MSSTSQITTLKMRIAEIFSALLKSCSYIKFQPGYAIYETLLEPNYQF